MQTAQDVKDLLTPEDIDRFMCDALNAGPSKDDSQGNKIFLTVDRHPDNPEEGSYKLYYYDDSKLFVSYTGGESMDIFELVQRVKRCGFYEAYLYVCRFFGISTRQKDDGDYTHEPEETADWTVLNKIADFSKERFAPNIGEKDIPLNIMEYFTKSYPQAWLDEGISVESMDYYGVRMDVLAKKAIIPHRDDNGKIIGIRGRAFDPQEIEQRGKYAPIVWKGMLLNHPLGENLYGLYEAKYAIQKTGKVCIVESEKACMQSRSFFGDNNFTVATCGSAGLSSTQIDLLLKYQVKEVILGYDKEFSDDNYEQRRLYEEKLIRICQPLTPFFDVYYILDREGLMKVKDSPMDNSKDTLLRLMKTKTKVRPITTTFSMRR